MSEVAARFASAGIVILHASAACINGRALLFLGPSGAGKSTICRLLEGVAQPLADDAAYVVGRPGEGWFTGDAAWPALERMLQRDRLDDLRGMPLQAVVRLFQAAQPRLEPLPAWQTCRYLLEAVSLHAYGDAATRIGMFGRLAALARSVPGYDLYFDLSPRTSQMILGTFGVWSERIGETYQRA